MESSKTITQTFRLDVKVREALIAEADKQRISLNTLVGHVLEDYVVYGRFVERFGIMRLGAPIVTAFLDEISEEAIKKIGAGFGESRLRAILAELELPFTIEGAARLIEEFLSRYAHWFELSDIIKEGDVWRIHLRHYISRKWSLFLSECVCAMFKTLKFRIEEVNAGDYHVILSLRAKG